jgi:hypothetical protein
MAELPLDDFWQARLFCFNESKKGGGVKRSTKSSQNMRKSPRFEGLVFLLTVNQERSG